MLQSEYTVLVSIARSVVLRRELRVRAAKQTAPSHGAESLSRVKVAFLSSHQSCQSWRCFWGGQSSPSVWSAHGNAAANKSINKTAVIEAPMEVSW